MCDVQCAMCHLERKDGLEIMAMACIWARHTSANANDSTAQRHT